MDNQKYTRDDRLALLRSKTQSNRRLLRRFFGLILGPILIITVLDLFALLNRFSATKNPIWSLELVSRLGVSTSFAIGGLAVVGTTIVALALGVFRPTNDEQERDYNRRGVIRNSAAILGVSLASLNLNQVIIQKALGNEVTENPTQIMESVLLLATSFLLAWVAAAFGVHDDIEQQRRLQFQETVLKPQETARRILWSQRFRTGEADLAHRPRKRDWVLTIVVTWIVLFLIPANLSVLILAQIFGSGLEQLWPQFSLRLLIGFTLCQTLSIALFSIFWTKGSGIDIGERLARAFLFFLLLGFLTLVILSILMHEPREGIIVLVVTSTSLLITFIYRLYACFTFNPAQYEVREASCAIRRYRKPWKKTRHELMRTISDDHRGLKKAHITVEALLDLHDRYAPLDLELAKRQKTKYSMFWLVLFSPVDLHWKFQISRERQRRRYFSRLIDSKNL
ncbi:hypothetical protein [Lysinibacter cavernae]|uniref:Uncharacterized protein n=1 Tax=Lysinibacter cavernae TaxID=1640652 RepID=A0A7X5TV27_9MICO|nr:hypothetical protein [Lysinibacter cavernae]NIH54307.1 hypothetical protein [Lysinibacter cavernae]